MTNQQTDQQQAEQRSNERGRRGEAPPRAEKTDDGPKTPRYDMAAVVRVLASRALQTLRPSRALWAAMLEALEKSGEHIGTGDFTLGEGCFTGVIGGNGPRVVVAEGADCAEATILVGAWHTSQQNGEEPTKFVEATTPVGPGNSRGEGEGEPPLLMQVKAFTRNRFTYAEAFERLKRAKKGDRISVTGGLVLRMRRDKNEQLRQSMEIRARYVLVE